MIEVAVIIFGMCFSGWTDYFFVFLSGYESSAIWRIPVRSLGRGAVRGLS